MADIIKLNVGGCIYTTSRSTLTRYPDSMLGVMFSGSMPTATDKDGNYWIDANGEMFRFVLDFLRRGRLMLPEPFQEFDLLENETDIYQIPEIIQSVTAQKLTTCGSKEKAGGSKKQYIVIEYHWGDESNWDEVYISGPEHAMKQLRCNLMGHPGITYKASGKTNIIINPYHTSKLPQSALTQEILNLGYELHKQLEYFDTDSSGKKNPQQWFVRME